MAKKTKTQIFLDLAKPDSNGISRWVSVSEFVGAYKDLALGNGGSWCRASSSLAKAYNIEFDKSQSAGNAIDAIRLNGFNTQKNFNQNIRQDIKDFYKRQNCVMLGICGKSKETNIRWDAKNIKGNPYSFYKGDKHYTQDLGCVGCYQYDPVAYRKECVRKIAKEASDFVANKLYPRG